MVHRLETTLLVLFDLSQAMRPHLATAASSFRHEDWARSLSERLANIGIASVPAASDQCSPTRSVPPMGK